MQSEPLSENISVMVRVRPLNSLKNESEKCITVSENTITIDLKTETKQFSFDYVAGEFETQEKMFNIAGKPLADSCLEGYNATVFAYGQTSAGKTFTIQGPTSEQIPDEKARFELRGLMPRIFDYIFEEICKREASGNIKYIVKSSYLEIYKEQIIDLLDKENQNEILHLREDLKHGVYVEGLTEEIVDNSAGLSEIVGRGISARHTGATSMNQESSRSHSVLLLTIESKTVNEGVVNIKSARFHIIDLAGSERQKSTDAVGERLKEAGNINKSLSTLGNVINALVETAQGKARHIHYRDSKLTFLLKDSLGGNSKTILIANISASQANSGETLSTLNFARRAKLVKNTAIVNEDTTGAILILKQEIKRLKAENAKLKLNSAPYSRDSLTSNLTESTAENSHILPENNDFKTKFKTLEQLFQTTVELRASDLKIQEDILREKDKRIAFLEKAMQKYQKDKERDKMIIKLKEAAIEKLQTDKNISPGPEIDALKKENLLLRESEEIKEKTFISSQKIADAKDFSAIAAKIAEQSEYFNQISKYLKEISEEKDSLLMKVKELENKLSLKPENIENKKIESMITKIKLEYGEKLEEISKKYLEYFIDII